MLAPVRRLLTLWLFATSVVAWAGGAGTAPGPMPPHVDLGHLEASASQRPDGSAQQRHPVVARLLVEDAVVVPESTVSIAILLEQDEHWHTYWKTPGDIGLPTDITWTLPEGASATDQVYPVPLRFEQEGIVSFGYDHQVLHIAELTLPADLAPGAHTIAADVEWLVCKTSCIPGSAHLERTLVVGEAVTPGPEAPLFDHWRGRWPTDPAKVDTLDIAISVPGGEVKPNSTFQVLVDVTPRDGHTLTVPPGDALWPSFTPIAGMDWMVESVTRSPHEDGFRITLDALAFEPDPLPADDLAGGLVQVEVDGAWVRTEVTAPLPWTAGDDAVAEAPPADAVEATEDDGAAPPSGPQGPEAPAAGFPLLLATNLLLAFGGGFILNLMPCVLPVLMLKLYGLVEQAGLTPADRRRAGLAYTGGILVSFAALAGAVWVIRSVFGGDVGWGFQMQYPGYVAGLATILFVFSLSLFGVFEIPAIGTQSASELGGKEGLAGHFFTGVFATLVATPCSAPLLGAAIAFAFQATTAVLVLVFLAIGLGLASPFLFVAFVPAAFRLIPKPGAWMDTFKQVLGFAMIAAVVWLVDVLSAQIGTDRTTGFLAFLLVAAFGAWIYGHFGGVAATGRRQLATFAIGAGLTALAGTQLLDLEFAEDPAVLASAEIPDDLDYAEHIPWQRFSPDRVDALAGRTLFVDFTADWCVSCKANEQVILETATVREAFDCHDVVPLQADWTRKDPVITEWLQRYERIGVPMYLVVPPTGLDEAILLPEVITKSMVTDAVEQAAGDQRVCMK